MEVIFINTLKFKRLAPRATPREPPSRIPLVKYSKVYNMEIGAGIESP